MKPVKQIHIQNPPSAPGALRLEPERLELVLAGRGLTSSFTISQGEGDHLPDAARDARILFLLTKAPLDEARRVAPGLKWVQTAYAGVEKTLPTLPKGLLVSNASGVHAEKGAEYVLGAALMLNSAMPQFIEYKAEARWEPIHTPLLRTKRVTMLGVGAIGAAAAVLLKRMGCVVWGVTRSGDASVALDGVTDEAGLDELLPKTDILISTLPETPDTDEMIDRKRIDALPHGAGIVSVGRAPALDYDAILDRLNAGSLSGAVTFSRRSPFPRIAASGAPHGLSLLRIAGSTTTPPTSTDASTYSSTILSVISPASSCATWSIPRRGIEELWCASRHSM